MVDPDGLMGLPISAIKKALQKVHKKLGGPLPQGKIGKYGSPQHGTPKKGYRLDPGHPDRLPGDPEAGPHINYWDYTKGKRGKGGISGAEPIGAGLIGFLGSLFDPFDAISGEIGNGELPDHLKYPDMDNPCK